ncbi:hypothetical protein GF324_00845 [bacterium]|nr:hypothetical protein [bacterium]
MPITISLQVYFAWFVAVLLIQTIVDWIFTGSILRQPLKQRIGYCALGNAVALLVAVLAGALLNPLNTSLLSAGKEGDFLGMAVLAVVVEYILFGVLFGTVKHWLVRWIAMEGEQNPERLSAWWGYTIVGSIPTILLAAPPFFIATLLPKLMEAWG